MIYDGRMGSEGFDGCLRDWWRGEGTLGRIPRRWGTKNMGWNAMFFLAYHFWMGFGTGSWTVIVVCRKIPFDLQANVSVMCSQPSGK